MGFTMSECYTFALAAGLPDAEAKKAAAIAMCESGKQEKTPQGVLILADPNAHNPVPPDDSWGLWQINMIGPLGPKRRAQFGITSNQELLNPTVNAKAMVMVYRDAGNSFRPWSTYGSANYFHFMGQQVGDVRAHDPAWYEKWATPLANVLNSPGINPFSTLDAARQALGYVGKTAAWVSNSQNWVRVGYVVGGLVVITVGLVKLTSESSAGRTVIGAVGSKSPAGLAVKAVTK